MTTTLPTAERRPDARTVLHVGWNIQHGWKLSQAIRLLEQFAQENGVERPHLLTLQELQDDQAAQVAERLGLTFVEVPNVRPGSRNALFFDAGMFRADPTWVAYVDEIRHRPATAKLRLVNPDTGAVSRREISVASIHLDFGNPGNRERQIRWVLANLFKDNWLALFQGDLNSWPVWGCPVSLANVEDRAFAVDRSIILPDGSTRPDDVPDRLMAERHLVDVGRYAATVLMQIGADRPTTWDGPKKKRQRIPAEDCPPGVCPGPIDRTYVAKELRAALVSSVTPDAPQVEEVSDHLPQITTWDLRKLWAVMNAQVELVRH